MNRNVASHGNIGLVLILASALVSGCDGSGPTGNQGPPAGGEGSGAIRVETTTTGSSTDDGFQLAVDGTERPIAANAVLTIPDVDPGEHDLALRDVEDNCAVDGENPRTVSVEPGKTSETAFQVTCAPTGGTLLVAVESVGLRLDQVLVTVVTQSGSRSGTTGSNGTAAIANVAEGEVTVNAVIEGGPCNARTAHVTPAQTTEVTIECDPGMVSGVVTVDGVGEADIIVGLFVATTRTQTDGRYLFPAIRPGSWTVGVVPPAGVTCPISLRTIGVPPGVAVTADFACMR